MIYLVYLSFGSNLSSKFGSPVDNIKQAYLELLKYGFKIKKKSSFYKSVAYPNANDPEFINSVVSIACHLEVEQLLKIILKIELSIRYFNQLKSFTFVKISSFD